MNILKYVFNLYYTYNFQLCHHFIKHLHKYEARNNSWAWR